MKSKSLDLIYEINEYAEQVNLHELDWGNKSQTKWYFYYDYNTKTFKTSSCVQSRRPGVPYFSHRNLAEQAVKSFQCKLLEYYLEGEAI